MPGVRSSPPRVSRATAPNIKLRGATSIGGRQDPLIIVDGVIIRSGLNGGNGSSTLSDIAGEDIDHVEVVKGAAAVRCTGPTPPTASSRSSPSAAPTWPTASSRSSPVASSVFPTSRSSSTPRRPMHSGSTLTAPTSGIPRAPGSTRPTASPTTPTRCTTTTRKRSSGRVSSTTPISRSASGRATPTSMPRSSSTKNEEAPLRVERRRGAEITGSTLTGSVVDATPRRLLQARSTAPPATAARKARVGVRHDVRRSEIYILASAPRSRRNAEPGPRKWTRTAR